MLAQNHGGLVTQPQWNVVVESGNKVYRDYFKNGKTEADYMYVHHAISEFSQLTSKSKYK